MLLDDDVFIMNLQNITILHLFDNIERCSALFALDPDPDPGGQKKSRSTTKLLKSQIVLYIDNETVDSETAPST